MERIGVVYIIPDDRDEFNKITSPKSTKEIQLIIMNSTPENGNVYIIEGKLSDATPINISFSDCSNC